MEIPKGTGRRHLRPLECGRSTPGLSSAAGARRALIVGVGDYGGAESLANPTHDARSVARVLEGAYGFRCTVLLDGQATLQVVEQALERDFADPPPGSQWLFFFAGHGLDANGEQDGRLLLSDHGGAANTALSLARLRSLCLASGYLQTLVVLDACYSGQALVRQESLRDAIEPEDVESRRAHQVICAGGPSQTVLDGGGQNHSVFTQSFVEALVGWSRAHDAQGTIPFSPLLGHLQSEVARRLSTQGFPKEMLQETIGGNFEGTSDPVGFVLRCGAPLLAPRTVQLGLSDIPEDRLRAMDSALEEARRVDGRLPMATELALRSLPGSSLLAPCRWGVEISRIANPEPSERKRAARLLGELADHGVDGSRLPRMLERAGAMSLLSLALRDSSPDIRHRARGSLGRLAPATRTAVARLARHHERGSPPVRRRAWQVIASLPEGRATLFGPARAGAWATVSASKLFQARRVATATPARRRLLAAPPVLLVLLYLYLGASFYLSPVGGWVGLRVGHPGLTALPLVGRSVLVTETPVTGVAEPERVKEGKIRGLWLPLHDGMLPWADRLLRHERPAAAGLDYWRLGDEDRAFGRLAEGIAQGDARSVAIASYVGMQSEVVVSRTADLLVTALEGDEAVAAAARSGLEALAITRPRAVAACRGALLARLGSGSADRDAFLLEALEHLEPASVEADSRYLEALVERFGRAVTGSDSEKRLATIVAGALARRDRLGPRLGAMLSPALRKASSDARDTVLRALALPSERGSGAKQPDVRLRVVSEVVADATSRTEVLRIEAAAGALIGRSPELSSRLSSILADHLDEPPAEDRLAAATAILRLSSDRLPRLAAIGVLEELIRSGSTKDIRSRAIETVEELSSKDELSSVVDALVTVILDHDRILRSEALDTLLDLELREGVVGARLVPVLVAALDDPSLWVRRQGAEGVLLFPDRMVATGNGGLASEAASLILAGILSDDPAGQIDARELGRRLALASARARRQFLQALERNAGDDDFWVGYRSREFVEQLLESEPTLAPEGVRFGAELIASGGNARNWGIELLWGLGNRPAGTIRPALDALLADANGPSSPLRNGATEAAAYLAARDGVLAAECFVSLRGLATDSDPELRLAVARAMTVLAQSQTDLSPGAVPILLDLLESPRSVDRLASARGLGVVRIDPASREAVLGRLASVLRDADREVRAAAADSFCRWATGFPAARRWVGALQAAVREEASPDVRVRQATALGSVEGLDEASFGKVLEILDLGLASDDVELESTALEGLWRLGVARPASAPEVFSRLATELDGPDLSLSRAAILAIREIGRSGPESGRVAVALLADRLLSSSWDLAWDAVVNGIRPICQQSPELVDLGIDALERFLRIVVRETDPRRRHLVTTVRAQLLDLLETASREDPERVWSLLASPDPWNESLGAELLARWVDQDPGRIPSVRDRLASFRGSIWPQVRLSASRAAEMTTILQLTHEALGDPERASRWRRVLDGLSGLGVRPAVFLALDRLEPGIRHV